MSTPTSLHLTRPTRRVAAVGVAFLAILVLSGGCATGGSAASASLQSPPRPASELAPDPGELAPGDDLEDLLPEMPDLSIPDMTVPDIDLPGLGEGFDRCMDLFMAYSDLVVLAFSGDPDGRLPGLFDELAAELPDDLQDDLSIVRAAIDEAASGGVLDAAGALIGEEFIAAN
ncbi:MAG: hypothetical protein ACK4V6_05940, partial [Microthrixaceae bacterium]